MANARSVLQIICALLAAPALAAAQPAPPARGARDLPIEVSPFVSTGDNDSSGVGVAVQWPITSRLGIAFEAEYRHIPEAPLWAALENNGVNGSVNLIADLPAIGRIRPFLVGGGGLEHYALLGQSAPYFLSRTGMSFVLNVGGGVRVPINDRVGIRTEVRWTDGWTEGSPTGSFRILYGATVGVGGR